MRVYSVVFLALLAIVVRNTMVSGSVPQGLLGPSTAAHTQSVSARALRTGEAHEAGQEDEERAIADVAKKLGKNMQAWVHDKKIATYVRYQSAFTNTDKTVQKFFKKNLTPDEVYNYLKLYKKKNRWAGHGVHEDWSPEVMLWKKYHNEWAKKNPRWETEVDLSWLSDPRRFFAE